MTVKELMAALSKLDPDLPVVLAKDEEGNGYYNCFYSPSVRPAILCGSNVNVYCEQDIVDQEISEDSPGFTWVCVL